MPRPAAGLGLALAVILAVEACATGPARRTATASRPTTPGGETLSMPVLPGWDVTNDARDLRHGMLIREWARPGQPDGPEAVTVVAYDRRTHSLAPDPESLLAVLMAPRRRTCPALTPRILASDPASLTYQLWTGGCPGQPPRHELGRILFGDRSVWHVLYTTREPELSDARREEWLARLARMAVVPAQ